MHYLKFFATKGSFHKVRNEVRVRAWFENILLFFVLVPIHFVFLLAWAGEKARKGELDSRFEDSICKKEVGEIGECKSKGGRIRANDLIWYPASLGANDMNVLALASNRMPHTRDTIKIPASFTGGTLLILKVLIVAAAERTIWQFCFLKKIN